MTSFVFLKSESNLYTVGYYDPGGKWVPVSDQDSAAEAAAMVSQLNGGHSAIARCDRCNCELSNCGDPDEDGIPSLDCEPCRLRKQNTELHRRLQQAEASVAQFKKQWDHHGGPLGGSFGRALLASECVRLERRVAELVTQRDDYAHIVLRLRQQLHELEGRAAK